MTRRYRESKTSASRRALLPILGAIPIAVAVSCSIATGDAAARPIVPAPAPVEQLWTGSVQPGVAVINRQNLHEPVGVAAKSGAATTKAAIGGGLHPVPVDGTYSDRVTGLTVNSGTAGAIIGAAAAGIPAAVFGAVPGALVGAAIGAGIGGIAGGVAMGIPTLGVGAPLGATGGALAGAGVGAAIGAVVGAASAAIPTGIAGGAAGYALGAATGIGNGQQS